MVLDRKEYYIGIHKPTQPRIQQPVLRDQYSTPYPVPRIRLVAHPPNIVERCTEHSPDEVGTRRRYCDVPSEQCGTLEMTGIVITKTMTILKLPDVDTTLIRRVQHAPEQAIRFSGVTHDEPTTRPSRAALAHDD